MCILADVDNIEIYILFYFQLDLDTSEHNQMNGKISRHYEIYIRQNIQHNDKNTIEQKGHVIIFENKGQMYHSMHKDMTKSSPLSYQYQSNVYQSEETNVVYIIILTYHHLMIMYETPKEGPVKEAKTSVNVYQLKNSFFIFFFACSCLPIFKRTISILILTSY